MNREEVEISSQDLKARLDAGTPPVLVDVRWPQEFSINKLPGAVLVPLDRVNDLLEEYEPDADLVVYCHHGIRSLNAVMFLRSNGFTRVKSLAGGIDHWSQVIDPSCPRY
jgi:rhodanese-related sulfurtransferase